MAQWKYQLKLKSLRDQYEADEFSVEELGQKVAEKIRKSSAYVLHKVSLEPIAKRFGKVKSEAGFNRVLESLYDWGDLETAPDCWPPKKMCWIEFAF